MSSKMNSIDQREKSEENKAPKLNKAGKHSAKHTNCQSIPSTLMAYGHNQASLNSSHSPSEGKQHHHHHHHHNHGHHQAHVIHRTTSESLRVASDIHNTESNLNSSNLTSMSGSSGTSSSGGNQPSLVNSMTRKPKTSSFQITSVTVGNKLSADNGDDSADDLDESHTDDNSRITDVENETPSFSEDTFSKEDVFFSNSALGSAPVIPTSSQYGLVIVDPDMGGVGGQTGANISNVHVSMADAGINIVGSPSCKLGDNDQKDLHHRNERFKVVKIESTEPFKRGRWMCMDYLDHSTLQGNENVVTSTSSGATRSAGVTSDSGVVIVENNSDVSCEPGESNAVYNANIGNIMANTANSPGQTLQQPLSEGQPSGLNNHAGSVQASIITQNNAAASSTQQTSVVGQNYSQPQVHQTIPSQQQYPQTSHMQGQSQPAQFYQSNPQNQSTVSNIHGATLPSNICIQNGIPTNFVPQVVQSSQSSTQAALPIGIPSTGSCADTNPATIVTQMQANNTGQPTGVSQSSSIGQVIPQSQATDCFAAPPVSQSYHKSGVSTASNAPGLQMDIHHSDINAAQQQPSVVGVLGVAPNPLQQSITPAVDNIPQQQGQQGTNQPPLQNISSASQENTQSITIINDVSSTVSTPQQTQASSSTNMPAQQTSINNEDEQAATIEADSERVSSLTLALIKSNRPSYKLYNFAVLSDDKGPISEIQTEQDTYAVPYSHRSQNLVHTASAQRDNTKKNLEANTLRMTRSHSLRIPSNCRDTTFDKCDKIGTTNLASSWSGSVGSDDLDTYSTGSLGTSAGTGNENSASGTSAVAIDNKIEQAMDLVKSHLMIAVREEVEVLKEKIAELMDRINQLELENTILKANVSQETLSQLSATMQTASKQPQNTNANNSSVS